MGIKKEKSIFSGLHIVSLPRPFGMEYFITATPQKGGSPEAMFDNILEYTKAHNAVIISQDVFGLQNSWCKDTAGEHHRDLPAVTWPVTCLDNYNPQLSGIYVWAVCGADVKPIYLNSRVAGNLVEDNFTRILRLGGLTAENTGQAPANQARSVLEQMEKILQKAKMDFSDVVRTWFYNQDITAWYKDFNIVRNKFFQEFDVYQNLVPASTGVGKRSSADTAIVAGALAVQGKVKDIKVIPLSSPLQRPALEYGSSFSRAVELNMPDNKRLYISGTASIEQDGKTAFPNDAPAQVKRSIEVIDAILKSRKMSWSDITRAIAFFKHADDAKLLRDYCFRNKLPDFPVIVTTADICRNDLLFEIEIEAIK